MSTASRNDRIRLRRPRGGEQTASSQLGSLGQDPWALGPKRLEWLASDSPSPAKSLALAPIAASYLAVRSDPDGRRASSLKNLFLHYTRRLEARAGTSPPLFFNSPRAPP